MTLAAASGLASAGNGNGKLPCNAGRGNGYEFSFTGGTSATGQPNDCDPGNSGAHNHGGDFNPIGV
jgi:hypothetical protein